MRNNWKPPSCCLVGSAWVRYGHKKAVAPKRISVKPKMVFTPALAVRHFCAYFCTLITSAIVKSSLIKEICERLDLQRLPLVQDEGDSMLSSMF